MRRPYFTFFDSFGFQRWLRYELPSKPRIAYAGDAQIHGLKRWFRPLRNLRNAVKKSTRKIVRVLGIGWPAALALAMATAGPVRQPDGSITVAPFGILITFLQRDLHPGTPSTSDAVEAPLYTLPQKENGASIGWNLVLDAPVSDMWDFRTMPSVIGTPISVTSTAEFNAALTNINRTTQNCIEVAAGTVITQQTVLPSKTGTGWLIIRVANAATNLPAGTRIATTDATDMFTMRVTTPNDRVLDFAASASHWRIIGCIFTADTGAAYSNTLVASVPGGAGQWTSKSTAPNNLVFDRCWFKAQAGGQDTRRGWAPAGFNLAATECRFSGFRDVGSDSQTIGLFAWTKRLHVHNCFLEADGEVILSGGVDQPALDGSLADTLPQDVVVSKCEFSKSGALTGRLWKNMMEGKYGERFVIWACVFHGNRMQAQNGIWNIITNNQGNTTTYAPHTRTQHWLFRCNKLYDCEGVWCGVSRDNGTNVDVGTRYIEFSYNLLFDTPTPSNGTGRAFQAIDSEVVPDCAFHNNTAAHAPGANAYAVWSTGSAGTYLPLFGHRVYNNIFSYSTTYGFFGPDMDSVFGTNNFRMDHNMVINAIGAEFNGGTPDSTGTNITIANLAAAKYTDEPNDVYSLASDSPGHLAGSDGRDLGCCWARLIANTAGVVTG